MHQHQERSTSDLAAAQAHRRKLAAQQQASITNTGLPSKSSSKIDRDLMYKAYQMRRSKFFPSQQMQQEKQSDSASSAVQADVAQTTWEEQDGQGKGNWQQNTDTNAIFSNGSALPEAVMAKYESLMPGVSLGQVQLHQGSTVDAALSAAGLHGLTDGTNVAVASNAPSGTLEHEIGHVGQRQEQGFSLNEGSRDGYEKDADNISAKLLNNQPVERFEQTANCLGLAARLQMRAIAANQAKCRECEDNQPGFVQQLMAKYKVVQARRQTQETYEIVQKKQQLEVQNKLQSPEPDNRALNYRQLDETPNNQEEGDLYVSNPDATQRGGRPLTAEQCNRLADRMEEINAGSDGKKGARQRERELLRDDRGLYEDELNREREGTSSNLDVETWTGHQYQYEQLLDQLQKLLNQWSDGSCNRHGLKRPVVEETRKRVARGVPQQPNRPLRPRQEPNQFQFPDLPNPLDWIPPIFINPFGGEQRI